MTTAPIASSPSTPPDLRRPARTGVKVALGLSVCLFLLYACFPTRNHYWDGIGFALNIEGLGQDANNVVRNQGDFHGIRDIYFNPNHLFYNLAGYLLFKPLHAMLPDLRAHDMLRYLSMLLSVGTSGLMFLALLRWSGNMLLSMWLTLLMALSATWWKFSTDADAYVPGTSLLMLGAFLLLNPERRPSGWKIGILHAMSMLLHQVAVFFLPAALFGIWLHPHWRQRSGQRREICAYLLAAGVPVLAAYAWVWFGMVDGNWSRHQFLSWLASNGGDSYAFRSVVTNLLESLRSILRMFFGGRVSLALEYMSPLALVIPIAVMILSLTRVLTAYRSRVTEEKPPLTWAHKPTLPLRFLAIWVGVYGAFQFVFLTEYPYYRLFCLPAAIFLLGLFINRLNGSPTGSRATRSLAAFVLFMATFNFTAYIYPYSHVEATPPMRLAHEASAIMTDDVLVLYKDFNFTCDNWMIRYFTPRTTWMKADLADTETLERTLRAAQARGQTVWLDTTLTGQFRTLPAMREWFQKFGGLSQPWGLVTAKHYIQFFRVQFP